MNYTQRNPDPALARHVEVFFHLQGYTPEHNIERIVPDGSCSVVIELDNQERWIADNVTHKPIQRFTGCWISGPHTKYFSISALANTELAAIRLLPIGLFSLLDAPLGSVVDQVIDAKPLLGGAFLDSVRS